MPYWDKLLKKQPALGESKTIKVSVESFRQAVEAAEAEGYRRGTDDAQRRAEAVRSSARRVEDFMDFLRR